MKAGVRVRLGALLLAISIASAGFPVFADPDRVSSNADLVLEWRKNKVADGDMVNVPVEKALSRLASLTG